MGLDGVVWISVVLALAAGLGAGVALARWLQRRTARAPRRLPRHWPLVPRLLANSEERRVWRWLVRAFYDHHVMIKVAVTRFTLPRKGEDARQWYEILNGVYCTFTVCTAGGQVLGCVDVPGRKGLSESNRQLKQTLLTQCGIAYWIVNPERLPTITDIRTAFLGDTGAAMTRANAAEGEAIKVARAALHAAVERQRVIRQSEISSLGGSDEASVAGPLTAMPEGMPAAPVVYAPQENSFLTPLDSRKADL
ncbi:uncharacterized protein DUF2726 [Tibeticola sediminis]|uniref:Uncharacterized protein DUF2726 n=1 Tax=Tibeticola sediminis TaxID=1917811 RepID=A0A3N4UIZ5_9BURK|nr:DUF2726 domain-containing protein [Tibeticola sediminis]RPE70646.1 uncharacterized protein DUF2726 [Tibeticola sediminis]